MLILHRFGIVKPTHQKAVQSAIIERAETSRTAKLKLLAKKFADIGDMESYETVLRRLAIVRIIMPELATDAPNVESKR